MHIIQELLASLRLYVNLEPYGINALQTVSILEFLWSGVYLVPILIVPEWVLRSSKYHLGLDIVVSLHQGSLIWTEIALHVPVSLTSFRPTHSKNELGYWSRGKKIPLLVENLRIIRPQHRDIVFVKKGLELVHVLLLIIIFF